MNNGGKPSRICLRKPLGSVTEAPRLGFSSRKQFFSPKTAEIYSQGAEGSLEQPLQPIYRKKGRRLPPSSPRRTQLFQASKNILEGPIQNFEIAICTPSNFDKITPSFVIYGKVTEALRKHIGLDFLLFFSSVSPVLS